MSSSNLPVSSFLTLEPQVHATAPGFSDAGAQTQNLIPVQQALYQMRHLPSPCLFKIRYSPGWPGTHDSLASASRVGEITDVASTPGPLTDRNPFSSILISSQFPQGQESPSTTPSQPPPRPANSLSSTEGLLGCWLDSQAQKPQLGSRESPAPLPKSDSRQLGAWSCLGFATAQRRVVNLLFGGARR